MACDFFGVDTVLFQRLYVLVFIHHDGHLARIASVTAKPVTDWEYVEHYNSRRPHRALSQGSPSAYDETPPVPGDVDVGELGRTDRLGGRIHEYLMAA